MRILLCLIILLYVTLTQAQNKQDYYWPLGFDLDTSSLFTGIEFDFNQRPFEPGIREAGLEFDQNNASICDEQGNLLFYSNGCAIANRHHQIMSNGDSINAGLFFDYYWRGLCSLGYPGQQNLLILSDPADAEGYFMIQVPRTTDSITFDNSLDKILYSYIDMRLDGGNGQVTEKNVILYDKGEILSSYLTAIAHQNQKDWWIVNPIFPGGFVIYLLDENGLSEHQITNEPLWDDFYSSSSGDARFSPDGMQFALFNKWDGIQIYDFDRSNGSLTINNHIPWHFADNGVFTSCEWSPNSRFLYLIQADSLFQLDTHIGPLEDGLEFIAEYNGIADPFGGFFFKSALGPDCRIYIRPGSSSNSFHVINKPNERGPACDFVQQAIRLPYTSATGSFPNFPRFRVDEEEKCDPSITSMFGDDIYWRRDMTVFPNPARDQITVELPELQTRGRVYIIDMLGQVVLEREAFGSGQMAVDISVLPVGRYSVEYVPEDNTERVVYTAALVVVSE